MKVKITDVLYDFDPQQKVFIHDKNTDIYYNIKTGEFNLTIPAGDIRDRFEITFKEDSTLTVNDNLAELFDIFQDNKGKNLVISNPKTLNLKSTS